MTVTSYHWILIELTSLSISLPNIPPLTLLISTLVTFQSKGIAMWNFLEFFWTKICHDHLTELSKKLFFLHSNKNLQYGFTSYTTYRILNYTTRTMPLGAKYYDYSVASQKTKTIYRWITEGGEKKFKTWKRSKEHYTLSQTRYQVKNVCEIIVWVILHFHRSHIIYNLRQALHMMIN